MRCLGYPVCVGTVEGQAHVPSCPMYVETVDAQPMITPEPSPETERCFAYVITKQVLAKSLSEALANEAKGTIVAVSLAQ